MQGQGRALAAMRWWLATWVLLARGFMQKGCRSSLTGDRDHDVPPLMILDFPPLHYNDCVIFLVWWCEKKRKERSIFVAVARKMHSSQLIPKQFLPGGTVAGRQQD